MWIVRFVTAAGLLALSGGAAFGHAVGSPQHLGLAWSFEPWVVLPLAAAGAGYALGLRRLRREVGRHRVIGSMRVAAFAAGMLVLLLALLSPIDTLGAELFSVHMVQHLLLMLAAPPLLVASRPSLVFLWALPRPARKRIGRFWSGVGLASAVRLLMHPLVVWCCFSGIFVFWHLPLPYEWALLSEPVHVLEHVSFLLSSLAFWTIVIEPSGRRRLGHGAALLFVASTAILSGLPGALMILTTRAFYGVHEAGAAAWGMTALDDQQLAGLIMWIPAGGVYVAAIGWLFVRWHKEIERRNLRGARRGAATLLLVLLVAPLLAGCWDDAVSAPDRLDLPGDAERGAELIAHYGCGSCHTIPGVDEADALVGPPLFRMGRRVYLAGVLRNTPDNMVRWLLDPQAIVPGNAMPDLSLTTREAQDITAYLYTLQ